MRCPFCNQDNSKVVDSRPVEDTNSIRRRRMCDSCGKRFTTYEKVETIPLSVIKKDQTREQYDRAKIQDGILRACYKRPIPIEKIEMTMDSIEGDIFDSADREIASTRIGRDRDGTSERPGCSCLCSVLHLYIVNSKMSAHLWMN